MLFSKKEPLIPRQAVVELRRSLNEQLSSPLKANQDMARSKLLGALAYFNNRRRSLNRSLGQRLELRQRPQTRSFGFARAANAA